MTTVTGAVAEVTNVDATGALGALTPGSFILSGTSFSLGTSDTSSALRLVNTTIDETGVAIDTVHVSVVYLSAITETGAAADQTDQVIIVQAAATLRKPISGMILAISPVLDDEPDEITIYAIPQALTLVYPISNQGGMIALYYPSPQVVNVVYPVTGAGKRGMLSVYSIPQVVNIVINEE